MQSAFHRSIETFSRLPGIGQRSATRIVFYLMKNERGLAQDLSQAIIDLKEKLGFCEKCGGISEQKLCEICGDRDRNVELLCVVEEPGDIFVIEKTGEFSGYYHVLMGALSPLDGVGPEELRIEELKKRIREEYPEIKELFIATNPTIEGDATADYIHSLFHFHLPMGQNNLSPKITRISHGIPTGSSIEFADTSALARSIRSRQELEIS